MPLRHQVQLPVLPDGTFRHEEAKRWNNGGNTRAAKLARYQFQLLYAHTGSLKRAMEMAEEVVFWGTDRRPTPSICGEWAELYDLGDEVIPPKVEQQFYRRLDNYFKFHALSAALEASKTSQELSKKVREGSLPPEQSSTYMHANNATGFIWDKVMNGGGRKQAAAPIQIGNLTVRPPKQLGEGKRGPGRPPKSGMYIDVKATEVPSDR